jgi:hypothetical protein
VLLSDEKVQKLLSDKFVTSWEMVREVPKVSIDFGGGKKLQRTLKGNTVMYLCTSDGKVLDAWPGVYTPEDFVRQLEGSLEAYKLHGIDPGKPMDEATQAKVNAYHRNAVTGFSARFDMPMRMTMSKAGVESPILKLIGERPQPLRADAALVDKRLAAAAQTGQSAERLPNYPDLFARYSAKLEDVSEQPMAGRRAAGITNPNDKRTPEELGRIAVQEDSSNNSFYVRPAVHLWLASVKVVPNVSEAKMTTFKTILHVPIDDPYLGLSDVVPPGTPKGGD